MAIICRTTYRLTIGQTQCAVKGNLVCRARKPSSRLSAHPSPSLRPLCRRAVPERTASSGRLSGAILSPVWNGGTRATTVQRPWGDCSPGLLPCCTNTGYALPDQDDLPIRDVIAGCQAVQVNIAGHLAAGSIPPIPPHSVDTRAVGAARRSPRGLRGGLPLDDSSEDPAMIGGSGRTEFDPPI